MLMKTIQELHQLFLASPKVSTDTRGEVEGSVFFALSGDNFNGNCFAKEALNKGAALAVIDDSSYYDKTGQYLLVDNVLDTLQKLALFHREDVQAIVVGITGSNGKTTTKELIARVLETEKIIVSTQGNLNNHIGVPITLLRITHKTQIAVVEMGANHPGEIAQLCELARPNIGIITNIGKAHLEGMGSYEGVIRTKNELFNYLRTNNGTVIVNADDPLLMQLSEGMHRITYGVDSNEIHGSIVQENPLLKLSVSVHKELPFDIETHLYGRYNFPNVMAAVAIGRYFGVKSKNVIRAIEHFIPENSRSQQLDTQHNHLFLDAYNANPVSMSEALNSFYNYGATNPWIILGDMFELGETARSEHQIIIETVKMLGFTNVIFVGKHFAQLKIRGFEFLETTEQAFDYLKEHPVVQANILIKGSRGMKLEKLVPVL